MPKQNRADIRRESPKDHPGERLARTQIELAACHFNPLGFDYQGSAVVHYYQKRGSKTFAFVTQLSGMDKIEEGCADVGWKELQKALMKAYGRPDGRRKDTSQELI